MGNLNWSSYNNRLLGNKTSKREYDIDRYRYDFEKAYVDSPSYHIVQTNGTDVGVIIQPCDAFNEKTFVCPYGTNFELGDVIYWKNTYWLIIEKDVTGEITYKGRIKQCNTRIRWQNPYTKEIISRWCIATKPYYSNMNTGTTLTTSSREYKIQIPYDEETILVNIDRRFILEFIDNEPKAYVLTSTDTLTNHYEGINGGFLIWNVEQTQYNKDTDNLELMVCDYEEPNESVVDTNSAHCIILGSDTIRSGGSKRKYIAKFINSNGEEVEGVTPIWNISQRDGLVIEEDNNDILLCIVDNSLIGNDIKISLTESSGIYGAFYKDVRVVSLYG